MNKEQLEDELQKLKEDSSAIELMRFLADNLVDEMENFPVDSSDSNEHHLNMLIRELEEDLDRIENDKLGKWNPESNF